MELGGANVIGVVTFSGNQGKFRATLPMTRSGQTAASCLHVAQLNELGLFTGLAILNAESQATSVTVRAFDADGNQSTETQFELAAESRVVAMLNKESFFGAGFSQVSGPLQVIGTTPVVTFVLFGDFNLQFLSGVEGRKRIQ